MGVVLILLFIGLPALELIFLLEISQFVGTLNTLILIFVTGLLGVFLVRQQGVSLYFQLRRQVASGQLPSDILFNGFLVFIGGLFLITPGFITDVWGFLMVFPFTRSILLFVLKRIVEHNIRKGSLQVYTHYENPDGPGLSQNPDIIDLNEKRNSFDEK